MKLLRSVPAAIILAGVAAITAASCRGDESDHRTVLAAVVAAPSERGSSGTLSDGERSLPGMAPLTTPEGVRRKVLIHEKGVALFDRPGGDPLDRPAPYWQPLYVFDTRSVGGRTWYRVGLNPRRATIIGWVPSEYAVEWNNRLGALQPPLVEGGRAAPLLVYETAEAWAEILETGDTDHEPIARAVPTDRKYSMPWPVAESKRLVIDGRSYELSRLLFLGEFSDQHPPASKQYTPQELTEIATDLRRLDVAFVLDNTSSTTPFIEAIVKVIQEITESLAGIEGVDLATSLVRYRDHAGGAGSPFGEGPSVTRTVPLTTDIAAFLRKVAPLRPAGPESPNNDWPEAAYDGLYKALSDTPWRGDLSERVVIWIGDNSSHPPGHDKNPMQLSGPKLAKLANDPSTHATVIPICIRGAGGDAEQELHRRQCEYLAHETGGTVFDLEGAADPLVEKIKGILRSRKAIVESRERVFAAAVEGKLDASIAANELNPEEVTQCFEFLRSFGDVDVDRIGPGKLALGTGWVLTESEGSPTLIKKVYIARAEIHFLIRELLGLTENLNPEFTRGLVNVATGARAGEYFKEERAETVDVFLRARGVPCGSRSLLAKSRAEIEHMSEEERRALTEVIDRHYVPKLINARNNTDLFPINVAGLQFGWILEGLLP